MAVFTQLAVVEFSLPPSQTPGEGGEASSKELDISVVVTNNGFQIVGTGRKLDMIPKVQGDYQYAQLRTLLKAIKFQYPSQKSVVLVFEGEVLYDDIIKFMDILQGIPVPGYRTFGGYRMSFKIHVKKIKGKPVLEIIGRLTGENVGKIAVRLELLRKTTARTIAVDLWRTTFMDSHGLAALCLLLASFRKRTSRSGVRIAAGIHPEHVAQHQSRPGVQGRGFHRGL